MAVSIRKFQRRDVAPLYRAIVESKASLMPWMPWCREDYDLAASESWVGYAIDAWNEKVEYAFAIEDTEQETFLGGVGLNQLNRLHRTAKLGYWVKTTCQNRGIATAAGRQTARFAFESLGLNRIEIEIAPGNDASRAVAVKLGAVYEGCFRNKLTLHRGPVSAHCYSLIPSDMNAISV